MIDRILDILSGHTGRLKRDVKRQMEEAAEKLQFEQAAELRDVIRGLVSLEKRQTTIDFRGGNRDVLGIARKDDLACCLFLRVREGKLLGREVHFLQIGQGADDTADLTSAAIKSAYLRRNDLPAELVVPSDFEDRVLVESILGERRNGTFTIHVPQRGQKRRLLELAEENAAHLLAEKAELAAVDPGRREVPPAARELAAALGLHKPPRDLVCFDISTLSGHESVGSAVWLRDGTPRKSEYRRFRIRETPAGRTDDYSMMQEVVGRYFQRRVSEDRPLPDLVIVDGGKGQLGAAVHAMEGAGVSDLSVVSLAKREEEVFTPATSEALRLDRRSPASSQIRRGLPPFAPAKAHLAIAAVGCSGGRSVTRGGSAERIRQSRGHPSGALGGPHRRARNRARDRPPNPGRARTEPAGESRQEETCRAVRRISDAGTCRSRRAVAGCTEFSSGPSRARIVRSSTEGRQ